MSDDAPKLTGDALSVTYSLSIAPGSFYIEIGDTKYVFPAGTTREQAQSVLDESIKRLQECSGLCPTATTPAFEAGDDGSIPSP